MEGLTDQHNGYSDQSQHPGSMVPAGKIVEEDSCQNYFSRE
jgi:hypothetical protein